MDAQHFVDVAIIADFKMVKQLTSDTDLILSCVAGSDKVRNHAHTYKQVLRAHTDLSRTFTLCTTNVCCVQVLEVHTINLGFITMKPSSQIVAEDSRT